MFPSKGPEPASLFAELEHIGIADQDADVRGVFTQAYSHHYVNSAARGNDIRGPDVESDGVEP